MNGISVLATIISVLSFPMAFLALLYPRIASPKGRWRGFFLYSVISASTLSLAVWTASGPKIRVKDWIVMDWLVLLFGGVLVLAVLTKRWWWVSSPSDDSSGSVSPHKFHGPNKPMSGRKKKKRGQL